VRVSTAEVSQVPHEPHPEEAAGFGCSTGFTDALGALIEGEEVAGDR
jgi:hypothetical protein